MTTQTLSKTLFFMFLPLSQQVFARGGYHISRGNEGYAGVFWIVIIFAVGCLCWLGRSKRRNARKTSTKTPSQNPYGYRPTAPDRNRSTASNSNTKMDK